MTIQAFTC